MKKFILAALALTASTVYAEQVVVMQTNVPVVNNGVSEVTTYFHMDRTTGQGYVAAKVVESAYYGDGPTYMSVFSDKVSVPGLVLMGDQAVYQGADGNVVCGTMGVSRVLRKPTFYLSGKCSLSSVLLNDGGRNKKLIVTLSVK